MIDIIIGGLVLIAVIFAVRKVIRNQKSGGCSGCSGCSSENRCGAYGTFEEQAKEALQKKNKE